jgi:hypothetical protein
MKLVAKYSWPLRDKMVSTYNSWPLVDEQRAMELANEFIEEALKNIKIPGFSLEIRVEE